MINLIRLLLCAVDLRCRALCAAREGGGRRAMHTHYHAGIMQSMQLAESRLNMRE